MVGAHALAVHGHPRATGDLELWVRASSENAARVWQALVTFGARLDEMRQEDLTTPGIVYQIGVAPNRIDILWSITGVSSTKRGLQGSMQRSSAGQFQYLGESS